MFGSFISAITAHREATEAYATVRAQEREAKEHYERTVRRLELIGRTFKCGPWRWRIDPKHADAFGRALTPEIKVTWLRT